MAISDVDAKILWGRAGGRCSNPKCKDNDLIITLKRNAYHIGEMAHVIPRSPNGPRGDGCCGGNDSYDNCILLCPTCHRKIDKAPSMYPAEMLYDWKRRHEQKVKNAFRENVTGLWPLFKLYNKTYWAFLHVKLFEQDEALYASRRAINYVKNILVEASGQLLVIGHFSEDILTYYEEIITEYDNYNWIELRLSIDKLINDIKTFYSKNKEMKILRIAGCFSDVQVHNIHRKNFSVELENFKTSISIYMHDEHLKSIINRIDPNFVDDNEFYSPLMEKNKDLFDQVYSRFNLFIKFDCIYS